MSNPNKSETPDLLDALQRSIDAAKADRRARLLRAAATDPDQRPALDATGGQGATT